MQPLFRPAIVLFIFLSVCTGIVYPLIITVMGQTFFPAQAGGSLIIQNGQVRGSKWIGQAFSDPGYFWSRPSATQPVPYHAGASGGSNLALSHPALQEAIKHRVALLRATSSEPIPVDLVTASASGLDPHISLAAAYFQIPRVASARRVAPERIKALVDQHTEKQQWGILGEPRVNVLEVNLALDK